MTPSDLLIGPTSNTHLNRCQISCVYLFMGHVVFGVTPQDRRTPSNIFTDFHRRRSCLTACEFGTFTIGGDLPQLAQPNTYDFFIIYFIVSNYRPWVSTLDVVTFSSPSHPFTKNGEFNITILLHLTRCNATCL